MIIFKLSYDLSSSATLGFSGNFYLFFVYVQNLLTILDLFPQMAHHIMFSFNFLVLVIYGFIKNCPQNMWLKTAGICYLRFLWERNQT